MKFGHVATADSQGAILAHAVRNPGFGIKKGEIVTQDHIAALRTAGVSYIVAARLEPGDVHENEASRRLAETLAGSNIGLEQPFTGRCNLVAAAAGLLLVPAAAIHRINAVDEAITVATLMPFRPVVPGDMVATIKIIPFSVPDTSLAAALHEASTAALRIAPFQPLRVAVVSTLLPGLKKSIVAKTVSVLEARLRPAGARIVSDLRADHDVAALVPAIKTAAASADLVVIFGASAITDRRDIIPAGIEAAGGRVFQLGMPVDPGNLLLIGDMSTQSGSIPVIGAPGCARSPKENGFDFVLQRLLAGLPVSGADLRGMGVGGLLSEIVSRPQPRDAGDD